MYTITESQRELLSKAKLVSRRYYIIVCRKIATVNNMTEEAVDAQFTSCF